MDRAGAEAAAAACQGKAIIKGVPLRVQWGRPKKLDNMDQETRMENARAGRAAAAPSTSRAQAAIADAGRMQDDVDTLAPVAAPPGQDDVEYAAMAGE